MVPRLQDATVSAVMIRVLMMFLRRKKVVDSVLLRGSHRCAGDVMSKKDGRTRSLTGIAE